MLLYESESVELKETYTSDLNKEIVAFANTNGGIIYIGVQDNGEISGIENTGFCPLMIYIQIWGYLYLINVNTL